MNIKILKIYKSKEEIDRIVDKIRDYSFKDLEKHFHFEFSIMEKATEIELLEKTFQRFDLIKSIELRENKKGQKHYSFNYELPDRTFVVIALVLHKNPPMIINGYHRNTNYKKFEKSLRKYYGRKFV